MSEYDYIDDGDEYDDADYVDDEPELPAEVRDVVSEVVRDEVARAFEGDHEGYSDIRRATAEADWSDYEPEEPPLTAEEAEEAAIAEREESVQAIFLQEVAEHGKSDSGDARVIAAADQGKAFEYASGLIGDQDFLIRHRGKQGPELVQAAIREGLELASPTKPIDEIEAGRRFMEKRRAEQRYAESVVRGHLDLPEEPALDRSLAAAAEQYGVPKAAIDRIPSLTPEEKRELAKGLNVTFRQPRDSQGRFT